MNGQPAAGRPGEPCPGTAATILRRDTAKSILAEGTYGGQQGFNVWLTLDPAAHPLEPGQDVMIACGPTGERVALLARLREVRDGRAVFLRQSPWRAVDTRAFPRFATSLQAWLPAGQHLLPATIVDISLGGMAIEVGGQFETASVDVQLGDEPASPRLPCLVVSKRQREDLTVLHLEFGILSDEAAARVERLVAEVGDGMERELLAS